MRRIPILVVVLVLGCLDAAFAQSASRFGSVAPALTNTPQTILQRAPTRTVTFCVIQGGAAQEDVIFRGVGGTPVYATVTVNAGQVLGRAMNAAIPAGGLEVVTSNAAGDVTVECTYRLGS